MKSFVLGKKRIAADMILNIIATGVPIFVLQIVIYPIVAARTDDNQYALMISMYSLSLSKR